MQLFVTVWFLFSHIDDSESMKRIRNITIPTGKPEKLLNNCRPDRIRSSGREYYESLKARGSKSSRLFQFVHHFRHSLARVHSNE